jgi:hypothetical protein
MRDGRKPTPAAARQSTLLGPVQDFVCRHFNVQLRLLQLALKIAASALTIATDTPD